MEELFNREKNLLLINVGDDNLDKLRERQLVLFYEIIRDEENCKPKSKGGLLMLVLMFLMQNMFEFFVLITFQGLNQKYVKNVIMYVLYLSLHCIHVNWR